MSMTRADVRAIFPEATEEQITAYLNAYNGAISAERAKNAEYKEQAEQAAATAAANATLEQRLKSTEESVAKMMSENARLKSRSAAITAFNGAGIAPAQYESLLDGIVSENEEATVAIANNIVAVIRAVADGAKATAKEELMSSTPTPAPGEPPAEVTLQSKYNEAIKSGNTLDIIAAADALASNQ